MYSFKSISLLHERLISVRLRTITFILEPINSQNSRFTASRKKRYVMITETASDISIFGSRCLKEPVLTLSVQTMTDVLQLQTFHIFLSSFSAKVMHLP